MKKNKNLIWMVGGLAVVAVGAFVWSQMAGADAQNEYTPNPYPALPPVGGSSGVNDPNDIMHYDPLAEFKPWDGGYVSTPFGVNLSGSSIGGYVSTPFQVNLGGPSTGLVTGIVAPGFTVGGAADEQPGFGVHYPGTKVF